jgi:hypothetical protein
VYGVVYVPQVCTAAFLRNPHCVWWLAAIAIAMVLLGCIFAGGAGAADNQGTRGRPDDGADSLVQRFHGTTPITLAR